LNRTKVFFPSLELEFPIQEAEFNQLRRLEGQYSIVISTSPEAGAIATVIQLASYGTARSSAANFISNNNIRNIRSDYEASGISQQLVQIVRSYERQGIRWVEVKPYHSPSKAAADSALRDRLKAQFANYATTDTGYQKRIKYHRFYAERVASLDKPIEVAWAVANALDLPLATQRELISLSEKELLQRLSRILAEK
jgi:hypothetical protein